VIITIDGHIAESGKGVLEEGIEGSMYGSDGAAVVAVLRERTRRNSSTAITVVVILPSRSGGGGSAGRDPHHTKTAEGGIK